MGICIGYRGTLNDMASIENLISDVRLFCQQVGWEFDEVSDPISGIAMGTADDFMGRPKKQAKSVPVEEWPEEETTRMGGLTLHFDSKNPLFIEETWRGIIAHPPETESLAITFDGKGRLCQYRPVSDKWVKGPMKGHKHFLCFPLFCKTSGEVDQHIAICMLLKMLRRRYIRNLKVDDDTDYFKTGDMAKLQESHGIMAGLIGAIQRDPAFLKGILKAAGVEDAAAEGAVLLPEGIMQKPMPARKTKKATIH